MARYFRLHTPRINCVELRIGFMKQGKDGLSLGFCLVSVACVVAELQAASVF